MPEQKFSNPFTGSDVIVVSWDMGMRAVDIAFGGTLLTQITDLGPLRTTGMQGAAPDGSHLVVRLVRGDSGEVFVVEQGGVRLVGGHVNFAASGPRIGDGVPPGVQGVTRGTAAVGLDARGRLVVNGTVIDERAAGLVSSAPMVKGAVASGRTWLLVFSILNTIGVVLGGLALLAIVAVHNTVDKTLSSAGGTDPVAPAVVKAGLGILTVIFAIFMVIVLVIAVAWWVLWAMSKGAKAALAFAIARGFTGFYLVCSALQVLSSAAKGRLFQGLVAASIGLALNGFAFKAFHGARRALVEQSGAAPVA